jgi:alpha-glucosidase (family GH31 glycosyl hydrolase)
MHKKPAQKGFLLVYPVGRDFLDGIMHFSTRGQKSVCAAWLLLTALCFGIHTASQVPGAPDSNRTPTRVISFEHVNQEVVLKCDVGLLVIKPFADNIVQVCYFPAWTRSAPSLWGIAAAPAKPKYRVDSTVAAVRLATAQLAVSVDRKTAQLAIEDSKRNVLLLAKQFSLKETSGAASRTFAVQATFAAPEDEAFFAPSQSADETVDRRGQTLRFPPDAPGTINTPIVPILFSSRKYGFVFNNPSKTTVTPGKDGLTTWDAESGQTLSFFIIFAEAVDDLRAGYRFLTQKSQKL